jgi:hypothetical protein
VDSVQYCASKLDGGLLLAILHWMTIAVTVGFMVAAVTFAIASLGIFLLHRDRVSHASDPFEDVVARLK